MVQGKLKIGGAWSGELELDLDEWTVAMLREEVARRADPDGNHLIKLICGGRILRDGDDVKLSQLGVKSNSKIFASKVCSDQDGQSSKQAFLAEEERCQRLSRLKAAATSLTERHTDGSIPVDLFNLELENQSGEKVSVGSETDQRAIMMGLMLHANGKSLIKKQRYKDALEVLTMGEEAFSLCDPKAVEMVDNVAILQIDMVWCYFMLRDISWLSLAGVRLAKAREGIERAHGKEASRMRALQGNRYPELALHLRMELLEGVVAYHSGLMQKSEQFLTSAQAKYFQLQIPDESLSILMSMGYKELEAKRSLRINNMNIESAVDFLVEEKVRRAKKREEDEQRHLEILEQKRYGKTALGRAVDIQRLNELVSIGFEKDLAAEALRRNENDTQKALDILTDPETNSVLQTELISRKRKKLGRARASMIEKFLSMGFSRTSVDQALAMFSDEEKALNHLLGQANESSSSGALDASNSVVPVPDPNHIVESSNEGTDADTPSNEDVIENRDIEMEDELTRELHDANPYSDYDIEVSIEGEAIKEYLNLLNLTK